MRPVGGRGEALGGGQSPKVTRASAAQPETVLPCTGVCTHTHERIHALAGGERVPKPAQWTRGTSCGRGDRGAARGPAGWGSWGRRDALMQT